MLWHQMSKWISLLDGKKTSEQIVENRIKIDLLEAEIYPWTYKSFACSIFQNFFSNLVAHSQYEELH